MNPTSGLGRDDAITGHTKKDDREAVRSRDKVVGVLGGASGEAVSSESLGRGCNVLKG